MENTQPEEQEAPEVVNLSQVTTGDVHAGLVRTSQTSIRQLNADEVDMQISAAGAVEAGQINAHNSALGMLEVEKATLQGSIAGVIQAGELDFSGVAAVAAANNLSATDLHAIVVFGGDVRAENIRTGIFFGRQTNGNVTTAVDGRTALMAAMVGGSVVGLILLAGKLLFGRKN